MAEQDRVLGTLVLVADEGDGPSTRRAVAKQVASVHQGPVVVLPHNWRIIDAKQLRAMLDQVELETVPRAVQEYKMHTTSPESAKSPEYKPDAVQPPLGQYERESQ